MKFSDLLVEVGTMAGGGGVGTTTHGIADYMNRVGIGTDSSATTISRQYPDNIATGYNTSRQNGESKHTKKCKCSYAKNKRKCKC